MVVASTFFICYILIMITDDELLELGGKLAAKRNWELSTVGARLINDARVFEKIMKGRRVYYETRLKLRTAIKAELKK